MLKKSRAQKEKMEEPMMEEVSQPTPGTPQGKNPVLMNAWQVFADFDANAVKIQARFRKMRKWILLLSVTATVMAIIYENYIQAQVVPIADQIFRYIVVLLPITVSMLLTWANKFERGLNYVLLRGAAESVKREIYEFRAKAGIYSDPANAIEARELKLWRTIQTISERLMKTEVNKDGLITYRGTLPPEYGAPEGDSGFGFIKPEEYIRYRLENQMSWYQKKIEQFGVRVRRLNFQIILFGALGTALAAFGFEIWIAATVAIVGALTTYLEYNQYENTLSSYNQASRDLESIRMWWNAVPELDKQDYSTYDRLVQNTETVLGNEHSGWIQNMKDALEDLAEEDKKTEEAMLEIVEKFMNDPDGEYIDADEDYIPAEIIASMGIAAPQTNGSLDPSSGGSSSGAAVGTVAKDAVSKVKDMAKEKAKEAVEDLVEEHEDDALDAFMDIFEDKAEDALESVFGDKAGDIVDSVSDKVRDKAEEAVDELKNKAIDKVDEVIDEKTDEIVEAAMEMAEDLEPKDLTPDMLEDLFGDLGDDDGLDDDDLADLFGDS